MQKLLFFSICLLIFLSAAAPTQAQGNGTCESAYGGTLPVALPRWLQTTISAEDLHTANRYDLLSGQLLRPGLVDGSICPSRGLNGDSSPNACGLEVTKLKVLEWQNQYDGIIAEVGQRSSVPPFLMKAVIAVESQFWPGSDWGKGEVGLGQMTEFGADLLLANRPDMYQNVCRQALREETCITTYPFQPLSIQAMLRGLVLKTIDASCTSCVGGIDPAKGKPAVEVLAETLTASCTQSARAILSVTGKRASELMTYEDFWRVVLANYHSGAGCLAQVLQRSGNSASWLKISANLSPGCASGATYIRRIEEALKP